MALPPRYEIFKRDIRREEFFWITFHSTPETETIEARNKTGMPGPYHTDRAGYFWVWHKDIEKFNHLTMSKALWQYRLRNIISIFLFRIGLR